MLDPNIAWALRTAASIADCLSEGDTATAGRYMNEIKDVVGQRTFFDILTAANDFGLSTYKRQKIMREAKQ